MTNRLRKTCADLKKAVPSRKSLPWPRGTIGRRCLVPPPAQIQHGHANSPITSVTMWTAFVLYRIQEGRTRHSCSDRARPEGGREPRFGCARHRICRQGPLVRFPDVRQLPAETAFICCMACPKGVRNGPCRGSTEDHCYVYALPCSQERKLPAVCL